MGIKTTLRALACAVLAGSLFLGSSLGAQDTIKWALSYYDPYIIVEGPDRGTGILDGIQDLFRENLKEYQHEIYTANVTRIEGALRNGEHICAQMLKTPEREAYMTFTTYPITITPSAAIVIKRKDLAKLDNPSAVSLEEILSWNTMTLGIIKSRSYGAGIDRVLKANEGNKNIYVRVAGDIYQGLLLMLMEERVDMIIGTPVETYYLARKLGLEKDIAIIRITEANAYNMGYIACPKNAWGLEVARKLDRILAKERATPRYRMFIERWIPEEMRGDFRKAYKEIYLNVK